MKKFVLALLVLFCLTLTSEARGLRGRNRGFGLFGLFAPPVVVAPTVVAPTLVAPTLVAPTLVAPAVVVNPFLTNGFFFGNRGFIGGNRLGRVRR